ncbi:DMT family transporter [Basfia succiniciproducens]|uniref:DMT family transporter n=1 Tax=Basfia succiniciproducens TaxID=653940 RepID=UPI000C1B84A3|nr:DMT family transporter [Basfia succiniciproducens]
MVKRYCGELSLVLVTILAAIGWFFSKYAIAGFPPIGFIGLRFFLAAIIFLPFAYKGLRKLTTRQSVLAGITGIIFTLFLAIWILAISGNTNFGEGAFLVSLSMLIAPLISWLIFKHKPLRSFYFAFPVAVCGLYFLVTENGLNFSANSWFYLLTSLLSAIYFVLNSQYAEHIPILPLTTIQLFVVGILCGGYSLYAENWLSEISFETLGWLFVSVLIATNLRFLLQTFGQKHCNIGNASIIMLLEPVWTLILSMILFSEILTWQKLSGCLLILCALVIYRYT